MKTLWVAIIKGILSLLILFAVSGCVKAQVPTGTTVSTHTPQTGGDYTNQSDDDNSNETGGIVGQEGAYGEDKSDKDGGHYDLRGPAILTVSPNFYDFHVQSLNSLNYATFTITHPGEVWSTKPATNITAVGLESPYAFRLGSYPGFRGTCTDVLQPSSSCQIVIVYQPGNLGKFPLDSFRIVYDNGKVKAFIPISLDGASTDIATLRFTNLVDDNAYYNFGNLVFGVSITKTFHLQYWGVKPATGVTFSGISDPFSIISNTCGEEISSSCDVVVSYTGSNVGRFERNLKVTYHNGSYAAEEIHGLQVETSPELIPATLAISDGGANTFGQVLKGRSYDRIFNVTRTGTVPATNVSPVAFLYPGFSFKGGMYPGTGGTCGDTIIADCTLVVTLNPTGVGDYSDAIKLNYSNGSTNTQVSQIITAQVKDPALLALVPNKSVDFGTTPVNYPVTIPFTLSNSASSIEAIAIYLTGLTTSAFSIIGNCPITLSAGESCSFSIRFKPTQSGSMGDLLQISYFDGITTKTDLALSVSGKGSAGAFLALSSETYDFGSVTMGSKANKKITVNYSGELTARDIAISSIEAPFSFSGGSYPGTGGTCQSTINSSCTIEFAFAPTTGGPATNTVLIQYNDGNGQNGSMTLQLNGTGIAVAPARLSFGPASYDFGNVLLENEKSKTINITHSGTLSASSLSMSGFSNIFYFTGGSYPGTGGTCRDSLSSGSCSISVTFKPLTASSVGPQTITLSYFDGVAHQQSTLTLNGTGVNLAIVSATGANFGSIPIEQTKDATVTFTNGGSCAATAFSIQSSATTAPFSVLSNTCGSTLAGGSNCIVKVRFSPAAPGTFSDSLAVSYYTGVNTVNLSSQLTGTSTVSITINTPSVDFGIILMGQNKTLLMTFTNSGLRPARSFTIDGGSLTEHFSVVSSDCGSILGAVSSCSVTIRFAPSFPGLLVSALNGTYDTGAGIANFHGSVSGTATIDPLIAVNGNHSCVRTKTGQLKCWGHNNYGQLGLGDLINRGTTRGSISSLPVVSLGQGRYPIFIALGYWHSCVILDNNSVKCWGSNSYGQLGLGVVASKIGDSLDEIGDYLPDVDLGTNFKPVVLSAGYSHICALSDRGKVKCWGQNSEGQLGLEDTQDRGKSTYDMGNNLPTVDLGGFRALQISAATSHVCVLLENQTIHCWGNNFFGQLGLGDIENRGDQPNSMGNNLLAVDLGTGEIPQAVTTGGAFTCAKLLSGKVKCWGRNESGILGKNWCQDSDAYIGLCSNPQYPLPLRGFGTAPNHMGDNMPYVDLGSSYRVRGLTTSNSSTCALMEDDSLKCWGANQYGQLGLGGTNERGLIDGTMGDDLPGVNLGAGLRPKIVASGNFHNCVLFSNDALKCWGYNLFGQLGLEDTSNHGDQPGQMGDNLPAVSY